MEIKNVQISKVSISMADHGLLTFTIFVKGNSLGCSLGNYMNGVGHLGAKEWKGNGSAIVAMMKIMDTVGVNKWEDLEGKYVRVKLDGYDSTMHCIGNLIEDKWFDLKEFFKNDDGHAIYVLDERGLEDEEGE
jgi:hypothetical protein